MLDGLGSCNTSEVCRKPRQTTRQYIQTQAHMHMYCIYIYVYILIEYSDDI
jgi:hypothetical protein